MSSSKNTFSSKLGVVAATVGSAVGLGTVWRFPNEVHDNGGSVFLIAYLICVLLMGIPVMLAEFSLGRGSRADSVGSFKKMTPNKKWWIVGATAVLASYIILSFYIVVSGWTLEYFWLSLTGALTAGHEGVSSPEFYSSIMDEALFTAWNPVFWTFIMIVINMLVLIKGVEKGIERMANVLMPLLFVILVMLCFVSLTLPGAIDGVEFFLKPDWDKMNPSVLISAVGQAFFSLSLGMGILITYSSYYPKKTKLGRTSVIVSSLVFLVAILMGLIIFPAMKSFGIEGQTKGASLIFVTLPQIFEAMHGSYIWSLLFFFLLVVAALTSTVSLGEVVIAFLHKTFGMKRKKACVITLLPMFALSAVSSLSLSVWSEYTFFGMTWFDFLDYVTANLMLPIVAILICVYVGHIIPKSFLEKEMTNNGSMKSFILPTLIFLIRYVSPLLVAAVLLNKFFEFV